MTALGVVYGDSSILKTLAGVVVRVVGLGGQDGVVSGICGTSLGAAAV